jgi:cobalt-zinc-cadmium efflux system membrane fusion protein
MSRLALRSPLGGTVVEKHLVTGESVDALESVFVVADLRTVFVRTAVPAASLARVREGVRAIVTVDGGGDPVEGRIAYLGPVADPRSRAVEARIPVPNASGALRPGLAATVRLVVEEFDVPVALPREAVVVHEGREVVFVRGEGGVFEARPVVLGRRDARSVEVTSGVVAGDAVVVRNAFLLKAELGKSSAEHQH